MKTQKDILDTIDKKVDDLRKESKADDVRLNKKLDDIDMEACKRFLIVEMTKIQDGAYVPNEEQKHMLHETKKTYNDKGGDSYVDSMFDRLLDKGLL